MSTLKSTDAKLYILENRKAITSAGHLQTPKLLKKTPQMRTEIAPVDTCT